MSSVDAARGSSPLDGGRRANSSITRRVIDGASSASPAATTRIGVDELLGRGVLEQEAARAGPQRLVDVLVQVERRQDEHVRRRRVRADAAASPRCRRGPACGCPSAPRRACSARDRVDRLEPVAGLADDLDVGLGVEDHAEARRGRAPGRRRSSTRITRSASRERQPRAHRVSRRPARGPALELAAVERRRARACRPGRGPVAVSVPRSRRRRSRSRARARRRRTGRPTCARAGPACLSALVSASCTIRYADRSTPGRQRDGVALDTVLDRQARPRAPARRGRPGCPAPVAAPASAARSRRAEDAEQTPHLGERLPPGLLDRAAAPRARAPAPARAVGARRPPGRSSR